MKTFILYTHLKHLDSNCQSFITTFVHSAKSSLSNKMGKGWSSFNDLFIREFTHERSGCFGYKEVSMIITDPIVLELTHTITWFGLWTMGCASTFCSGINIMCCNTSTFWCSMWCWTTITRGIIQDICIFTITIVIVCEYLLKVMTQTSAPPPPHYYAKLMFTPGPSVYYNVILVLCWSVVQWKE